MERTVSQGLQIVIGITLARLLAPEDFGLIAMLALFLAISASIADGGLSQALVQKQHLTAQDTSTVFYFNVAVGSVITLVIFAAAPYVSEFYSEPKLTLMLRILSLNIIFASLNNVQTWLLNKELNFKLQFQTKFASSLTSGFIAITLAILGYGVWSLVVHSIVNTALNTALVWKFSAWRPSRSFSLKSLRELFAYGFNLLLSGQLNAICNELYYVVVGKLFSAYNVGFFARARQTADIPSNTIASVVRGLTFPAFSRIQDDRMRMKLALRKSVASISFVHFPVMVGLAVVAQPTVTILLTEKWNETAPLLQLFCFAGITLPIKAAHGSVALSIGNSKVGLQYSLVTNALLILFLSFTWRWGLESIIWGQIAVSLISYFLFAFWSKKNIGYRLKEQLTDTLPYLAAATIMGGATLLAGSLLINSSAYTLLAVQIVVGLSSYLIICALFRPVAYRDATSKAYQYLRSDQRP